LTAGYSQCRNSRNPPVIFSFNRYLFVLYWEKIEHRAVKKNWKVENLLHWKILFTEAIFFVKYVLILMKYLSSTFIE